MIKQDTLFIPGFPSNTGPNQETMFVDTEPNPTSDPISDWLEDSASYIPSFLDDPFGSNTIIDDRWWVQPQDLDQEIFSTSVANSTNTPATTSDLLVFSDQSKQLTTDSSKKRKAPSTAQVKKPVNRRGQGKSTKDGCNSDNRSGRWAEQLLNPCASAISAGNVSRVRHLLVVLRELASPTGDANYRLAAYGLQALSHYLSTTRARVAEVVLPASNFSTVKPKFFQQSLINFNDINPWFTIPNHIANNAILQVLSDHDRGSSGGLHILDIGVSHGVQWPTLLEALSRLPRGPPPLVRLTIVTPTPDNTQIPFANGPPGHNFISNILRLANDYKINLHINTVDSCPLQNLNTQIIKSSPEDILIVCAQFRLHNLNHNNPDNRTEFLKAMRRLEPKGVILNDNNADCSCNSCSTFETGFARKVDNLWSFLDSTSVAFKGRDMDERKMMEGEASKALMSMCSMNERKEKWAERMIGAGFAGDVFREDVMEGARALLRKYDNNWELRVDECVGLWWKGQPVSFCSLWKIDSKSS
ncbi:putative transcription factor GRAS family [Helianthus annuus]|uniref:Putative nodulation-signaling pathway 1 protein n=1 Tax=Helianthus annuus TaxID=4232 RepID=A0A251U0Q2_HELAN|nr:protein NODULATION SIGNALING PATHWAY 1 [Helianthus annuus]KAF5793441.1 putative transcription factor GRAS family [Helianthus annuus]KAJ0528277.1 putative transcription factor GRAS family [Helianthus annuus]KAJ0544707.1 putative transcription factor GRAS family [Helianthus annuus]KAJ0895720.1 putative transcription factor GRAS family [Helianthus annuus]